MTKKVKAGLTILLNTVSNTTFIASTLDEQVQTGTRENDKHIEWVGELDIEVFTKESAELYAKHKAIEFAEWVDDMDSISNARGIHMCNDTEELYNTFNNKQPKQQ